MAALILLGSRWVPLVFASRIVTVAWFSAWDWRDHPVHLVADGVVVVGCYWAAAAWMRRIRMDKAHTPQFAWFTAVAVLLAPAAVTIGESLIDASVNDSRWRDSLADARLFFVGDALAIATIVPIILLAAFASRFGRQRIHLPRSRTSRGEAVVQAALVFVGPAAVVGLLGQQRTGALLLLSVLPLLWVALRQDLIFTAIGVWFTTTAVSLALRVTLSADELLELQLVLLTASLAALYAAAIRRTEEDRQARLLEHQARYRTLVDTAPIDVAEFDRDGRIRSATNGGPLGSGACEVANGLAHRWSTFGPQLVQLARPVTFEWDVGRPDRTAWYVTSAVPVRRADGEIDGVLAVTTDRTEVRRAQIAAARSARHDELTGLETRSRFLEGLDELAAVAAGQAQLGVAAVLIDDADVLSVAIDDRSIDQMMVEISARVATATAGCTGVARIGARSFAFATIEHPDATSSLDALAGAVLRSLHRSIVVGSGQHAITATIGTTQGSLPPAELLRRAELAAHAGQAAGGDRIVRHSEEFEQALRSDRNLIAAIRSAVEHDEFEAWFQPVVDLGSRRVVGAEALARWRHPTQGIIAPDVFIPLAERTGLITAIDLAVLDDTVVAIQRWERSGRMPEGFSVSVNLSQAHLHSVDLMPRLEKIAVLIDPRRLRFEITETCAMDTPERATEILQAMKALGFTVILDDFGTGYSSMAWLHRLPVQVLKIDRTFVEGLPNDYDSQRIVELVATLADDLGMTVTAEGVETEDQVACLSKLGCHHGQGFHFGHPAPADALVF